MTKNYQKTKHDRVYDRWNELKKALDKSKRYPIYREGQIWWVSIGRNVGTEIYGKSEYFSRPMLILKRNPDGSFIGLPLTTKLHNSPGHIPIVLKGRPQRVVISQTRNISPLRLCTYIGELGQGEFSRIQNEFIKYLKNNIPSQPKQRGSWVSPKVVIAIWQRIHTFIIAHFPQKVNRSQNPPKIRQK